MRIASVRIKNFRSFDDETIFFNNYSCLVGPNGAGKSTVLCALNVFFRETEHAVTDLTHLDREDFHSKNTKEPIEITVTFGELNDEAQKSFADYYRQGKLVVSACAAFEAGSGRAIVKQYGQRFGMLQFREFFRAVGDKKKVKELKEHYAGIQTAVSGLPAPGTMDSMVDALRTYEAQHPEFCELIPSEDQFYGVSKGVNRLEKYLQWVFVPAVKDATAEQVEARDTALGRLLSRTVRAKTSFEDVVKDLRAQAQGQYEALLGQYQHVLEEIGSSLQQRLAEWAHPGAKVRLEWRQDPDKSVRIEEPWARIVAGEGNFEGELSRFGHGLQRSYLLALLQELAGADDSAGPTLVLGCEEPELYQHPPQARHLAAVLQNLSQRNSQIIVSTHNPLFVSGEGFEDVRLVRRDEVRARSMVSHMTFAELGKALGEATGAPARKVEGVLAKIHRTLQPALNEMFFAARLVLVEGAEDVAYVTAYLHLLDRWDDFRRVGCHIVPVNGKSELLQPVAIAKHMGIPTFVVFDADGDKPDKNGSRSKHEKDNKAMLALLGRCAGAFPDNTVWGKGFVMWPSDIRAVVEGEIGAEEWQECEAEADKQYGHAGNLTKNSLHIGASLSCAWSRGRRSPSLETLCKEILDPAKSV